MYLYLLYDTCVDLAVLLIFFLFWDCYQINSPLQVDRLIFNVQFYAWEFHSHLVWKGDRIRLTYYTLKWYPLEIYFRLKLIVLLQPGRKTRGILDNFSRVE